MVFEIFDWIWLNIVWYRRCHSVQASRNWYCSAEFTREDKHKPFRGCECLLWSLWCSGESTLDLCIDWFISRSGRERGKEMKSWLRFSTCENAPCEIHGTSKRSTLHSGETFHAEVVHRAGFIYLGLFDDIAGFSIIRTSFLSWGHATSHPTLSSSVNLCPLALSMMFYMEKQVRNIGQLWFF